MAIPFPEPWLRDRPSSRTLAALRDRRILTEHGEILSGRSWRVIADALFAHDLVLYAQLDELLDALDDEDATITTRADGSWTGIAVRRGRKVRHVYDARQGWGRPPDGPLLSDIRTLYAELGVRAAPSTASGLGVAAMRRHWSGETLGRPTFPCWQDLHSSLVGGRVDTLQPGRLFPTLYELDMNAAYPTAAARHLPGGSAVAWRGRSSEPLGRSATGYYRVTLTIWQPLTLGPVVLRGADGEPNVIPALPGVYRGWLWAEDVELLRRLHDGPGCPVTVRMHRGWYWRRWARGVVSTRSGLRELASPLTLWARRMARARRTLPPGPASMAKLAAVAGIGRFGGDLRQYRIVRERLSSEDRQITDPTLGVLALWVHADERDASTALVHLASYIQAAVRRELYEKALPYAEAGGLVASNFDAIYVSTRPAERSSKSPGGWKLARLQDAVIPAARHLRSRTKVTLPGVPLAGRDLLTDLQYYVVGP